MFHKILKIILTNKNNGQIILDYYPIIFLNHKGYHIYLQEIKSRKLDPSVFMYRRKHWGEKLKRVLLSRLSLIVFNRYYFIKNNGNTNNPNIPKINWYNKNYGGTLRGIQETAEESFSYNIISYQFSKSLVEINSKPNIKIRDIIWLTIFLDHIESPNINIQIRIAGATLKEYNSTNIKNHWVQIPILDGYTGLLFTKWLFWSGLVINIWGAKIKAIILTGHKYKGNEFEDAFNSQCNFLSLIPYLGHQRYYSNSHSYHSHQKNPKCLGIHFNAILHSEGQAVNRFIN